MEFGDDIIRRCPDCHVLFAQRTWLSAGTYGMEVWTDGYWSSHYLNIEPLIAFCPFCGQWVPIRDMEELFTLPMSSEYSLMPIIELDDECKAGDYLKALESPRCLDMERELRMRLWWRQNENRRAAYPDPADRILTDALHDNLERLLILFGPEDGALKAEALRELGDFDGARRILAEPDGEGKALSESEPGRTILIQCDRENILPVRMGSRPVPVYEAKPAESEREGSIGHDVPDPDLREVLSRGLYPFPFPEDIYALPTRARESSEAFLAVDLSVLRDEWSGWAAFFPKEAEHRFKYGRLFTIGEWRKFKRFPAWWQEELKGFWTNTSYTIGDDPGDAEDYYRIRYQLYHGYTAGIDRESITARQEWFNPFWHIFLEQLAEEDGDLCSWICAHESRCYWDLLWDVFEDGYPDLTIGKARTIREKSLDRERRFRSVRARALDGLQYVELGGFPHWFQGSDKTPASLSGERMDFVGQVWTDYLNGGSSALVYVFYDHENGYLAQVYDYD